MRIILTILFIGILGCHGQIINASAAYVPMPSSSFLLDAYPNAGAAYSLRKLKSSYSGSAIRIRRDSTGNAETDIGFLASGELDTNTIKTHCRNNSCMVTTWYNQGDSTSIDFVKTTAAQQPRIVTTGTIERKSGKPTIRFDFSGTADRMEASSLSKFNYLHQSGKAAVFILFQAGITANPDTNYYVIGNNAGQINRVGYGINYRDKPTDSGRVQSLVNNNNQNNVVSNNNPNTFFPPNSLALLSNLLDNANVTAANRNILYRNGTNEQKLSTTTGTPLAANSYTTMLLGSSLTTLPPFFDGFISEIIMYPTDQTSNRTGIESNINSFYSLW